MDWNLSYQDLILGHALRPWTDGTRIGLSLLDMFEQLDSIQWNSVGIIAHVNYWSAYAAQAGITADNDYLSRLSWCKQLQLLRNKISL